MSVKEDTPSQAAKALAAAASVLKPTVTCGNIYFGNEVQWLMNVYQYSHLIPLENVMLSKWVMKKYFQLTVCLLYVFASLFNLFISAPITGSNSEFMLKGMTLELD